METRKAVVFGGSSGIGEAAAAAILRAGDQVAIVGRDSDKLEAAKQRLGKVELARADASDSAQVARVFSALGQVDDVVICVSGAKGAGPFRELELADVRQGFEAKTMAQLTVAQVACRHVRAGGSITFIGAASTHSVIRGSAGLAAINAAIEAVVPILALELAPIRVNAVSPGIIDTPWWEGLPKAAKDGFFAQAEKVLPAARVGRAQEVGELIALIARNGFITGSVYTIDGGGHLVTQ